MLHHPCFLRLLQSAPRVLALALSALGAAPALAHHDAACQVLPTNGQRVVQVDCNPRQACFAATPNNPACNAAPTSGKCPSTQAFNPRQECLAALPPTPQISITTVGGGPAGNNRAFAGQPAVLRVQGQNVGLAGNVVFAEAGVAVGLVPMPQCTPPGCVGLSVVGAPNAVGVRRFTVRTADGHSQAEAAVELVPAPPPPQVAQPGPGPGQLPRPGFAGHAPVAGVRFAAPFEHPAMFSSPTGVDHNRTNWNALPPYEGRGQRNNLLDCRNYQGRAFPFCYQGHEGTDFMLLGAFATMDSATLSRLARIVAVAPGMVMSVDHGNFDHCYVDPRQGDHINCQGGGNEVANFVDVQHDDGLVARYFHLKRDSVTVRPGQRVGCGQVLGVAGSSGRSSAPHLHFSLVRDAVYEVRAGRQVLTAGTLMDPYAEQLWISLDGRQVPDGVCPGAPPRLPGR